MDIRMELQNSQLCKGLTEAQLTELMNKITIKEKHYKNNEILFYTDNVTKIYILVKGNAAIAKNTISGKRILGKNVTKPGELAGEIYYFSHRNPYWEYVIVLEPTTVLEISGIEQDTLQTLDVALQNRLLVNLLKSVTRKFEYIGEKIRMVSEESVRAKISNYLFGIQDDGIIELTETREEIADYLDITRPSLSRELGRMQKENIIRIEGSKVIVLDSIIFESFIE
ncbi:Crp/Fnr family transcriptional regulator [Listeria welshimeri]|uniref:Crp/Fnr family transcriptional regulator n=1 Tax=Listeria welshimeri TaxID=1643 RepID=UPI001628416B|nr:Crp/Fnr family transcriptional regulator [Listeria welshimeri]MBC1477478.1 Crp/Fnr family transcriptional regulator [Listeria welshimeri]MBC1981582.1 Crp/Fnr family transcriptional regulator [Listeria welshimeri]MBC2008382.1 Crp/Fnr family transcriptional regulator [Listeria welshimeri]MBC2043240.1 Crp/Fnr family transcriptional regulator [Listeria welshimeri]MBF2340777.1 Crp/Fnr family transcriptional regulator [Listeria welshimeri]